MNIAEKLKNLPKGNVLYSPAFGEVIFKEIVRNNIVVEDICKIERTFLYDGRFYADGECMLFPSKENRDWSKFNLNKFDVNSLKPFDKVLARDQDTDAWSCELYSHYRTDMDHYKHACSSGSYHQCIPYNEETKHLVGTNKDCPEYFKTW